MSKTYTVSGLTRFINMPFAGLARLGLGADFRHVLRVRGRRSGKLRSTPVDAIAFKGKRWLVAPYGVTNWVRNVRAAGEAELTRGGRRWRMRIREAEPDEAALVLRRYLELVPITQPYVDLALDAPLDEFRRAAAAHPVFELTPA